MIMFLFMGIILIFLFQLMVFCVLWLVCLSGGMYGNVKLEGFGVRQLWSGLV